MTMDSPDDLAHDTVTSLVFKDDPLGKSIIGTPTSLKRISRNVITDYITQEYTRDSLVVSITGNFDEEEICNYFEEKFQNLKACKPERKINLSEYSPSYKVIVKDIEQSHICLATKGVSLEDERYYAFSILNNLMGGSMSSRFFQNIREEKGLAYSVFSMSSPFSYDGYYNIYAGVGHNKIPEAIEGIKEELAILSKEGVTKEELESSREQMKASYIFSLENVAGRMFKNGKNMTLLGRPVSSDEIIGGFNSVILEDIEEVKKMICDVSSYSAVAVTNKKIGLKKIMEG